MEWGIASARGITAPRSSAYRCFLPDLTGLGGCRSHDSWQRQRNVTMQRAEWQASGKQPYGKKNISWLWQISPLILEI